MNHPARLKHASDSGVFFNALAGFAIAALVVYLFAGTGLVYAVQILTKGGV